MFVRVGAANDQRWNDNKENAMSTTIYQQSLAEIRAFIERNLTATRNVGDPVGVDIDAMTPGEHEAYNDGKAAAYEHVLSLLAPGRVADERPEETCEGYGPRPCSMCGETTHSERERTDDGEWSEDCEFVPFFDGDGRDLRRPGQAGRSR